MRSARRCAVAGFAVALLACADPNLQVEAPLPEAPARAEAPRTCLRVEAASNLNVFDGQSHVVVLYFFPLQSSTAFQEADLRDLLRGSKPAGLTGDAWDATVLPGRTIELDEPLPQGTVSLGVLADFYRGPRKVLLSVACTGERLVLSGSDMQVVAGVGAR